MKQMHDVCGLGQEFLCVQLAKSPEPVNVRLIYGLFVLFLSQLYRRKQAYNKEKFVNTEESDVQHFLQFVGKHGQERNELKARKPIEQRIIALHKVRRHADHSHQAAA